MTFLDGLDCVFDRWKFEFPKKTRKIVFHFFWVWAPLIGSTNSNNLNTFTRSNMSKQMQNELTRKINKTADADETLVFSKSIVSVEEQNMQEQQLKTQKLLKQLRQARSSRSAVQQVEPGASLLILMLESDDVRSAEQEFPALGESNATTDVSLLLSPCAGNPFVLVKKKQLKKKKSKSKNKNKNKRKSTASSRTSTSSTKKDAKQHKKATFTTTNKAEQDRASGGGGGGGGSSSSSSSSSSAAASGATLVRKRVRRPPPLIRKTCKHEWCDERCNGHNLQCSTRACERSRGKTHHHQQLGGSETVSDASSSDMSSSSSSSVFVVDDADNKKRKLDKVVDDAGKNRGSKKKQKKKKTVDQRVYHDISGTKAASRMVQCDTCKHSMTFYNRKAHKCVHQSRGSSLYCMSGETTKKLEHFEKHLSLVNEKLKQIDSDILKKDYDLCVAAKEALCQENPSIELIGTHIKTETIRGDKGTKYGNFLQVKSFKQTSGTETSKKKSFLLAAPKAGTSQNNKFCTANHQTFWNIGKAKGFIWVIYQPVVALNLLSDRTEVHILCVANGFEHVYETSADLKADFDKGSYKGKICWAFLARADVSKVQNLSTSLVKQATDQLEKDDTSISLAIRKKNVDHVREVACAQGSTHLLATMIRIEDQRIPTILEAENIIRDATINLNHRCNLQDIDCLSNCTRIDFTGGTSKGETFSGSNIADHKLEYSFYTYSLPTTTKKFKYVCAAERYDILKIHQNVVTLWKNTALKYKPLTYEHRFASLNIRLLKEFVFRFAS